jgi:membrane fusion protein, multidrug efflux system
MDARRLAVLAAVVLLAAACGGERPGPAQPAAPEVAVQRLTLVSGARNETLVGRLSALRSAEVRARVAGILQQRVYVEGSDVAAGELMFRIDPAPLAAELAAREAELARARARAGNSRIRAERLQGLAARGAVSAQAIEDAQAEASEAAAAELEAAAQREKARLQLSFAEVRAPIDGRAGRAQVTEGALVGEREATPLATIEQIDPLYLDLQISVAGWEQLRAMQAGGNLPALSLTTPGGRLHPHPATLQFSEQAVDPRTGTIALRATVPNPDSGLLPGMFVTIEVALGAGERVFRLPQTAVLRDSEGAYVLLLGDDDVVERRTLQLDGSVDGDWIVREGLAEGERLIIDRLQRLRPGSPARAAEPAASGSAG